MLDLFLAAGLAIFISASCSVTEAVLYSVPWSYIERLRNQGRRSGHILFRLRTDVEKPISAILILNTVANTAGASIAGAAAVRVFGADSLTAFAVIFTISILIFSEILPKTIGVAYCRTLAPILAIPLRMLVRLFSPFIWVTSFLAKIVTSRKKEPGATEEDIAALVSLTRQSGMIKPYEEMTIKNILALDRKKVEDIMTPRTVVFSLSADATTGEVEAGKKFLHYSRIPVYDNDEHEDIVGIVDRLDILRALTQDQRDVPLSALMRPVRFVLETLSLDRLLPKLLESRTHLFVVLDEYGGVAGVVSLEDLMEEILGREIVDETDQVEDLRELARTQRRRLTKTRGDGL